MSTFMNVLSCLIHFEFLQSIVVIKWQSSILSMLFQQEESNVGLPGGNGQLLTLGLGLLVTALAATYVTRLAKVNQLIIVSAFSLVCP